MGKLFVARFVTRILLGSWLLPAAAVAVALRGEGFEVTFVLERLVARPEALIEQLEEARVRLVGHAKWNCGDISEEALELAVELVELTEAVLAGLKCLVPRLGRAMLGGQRDAPRYLLAAPAGNRHFATNVALLIKCRGFDGMDLARGTGVPSLPKSIKQVSENGKD